MTYGGEYTVNHGDRSLGTNATELVFSNDERIESIEVEYASHPTNEDIRTGMKNFRLKLYVRKEEIAELLLCNRYDF